MQVTHLKGSCIGPWQICLWSKSNSFQLQNQLLPTPFLPFLLERALQSFESLEDTTEHDATAINSCQKWDSWDCKFHCNLSSLMVQNQSEQSLAVASTSAHLLPLPIATSCFKQFDAQCPKAHSAFLPQHALNTVQHDAEWLWHYLDMLVAVKRGLDGTLAIPVTNSSTQESVP